MASPGFVATLVLQLFIEAAQAQQSGLPSPTRTAFKCVVGKSTVYSDEPCVGAQRVELQPSRGLNKSSGKELTGADVQRERSREQVAEAVRPLTGKSNQEFETYARRANRAASVRSECAALDASIPRAESQERATEGSERASVQRELFGLRSRYRQLAC